MPRKPVDYENQIRFILDAGLAPNQPVSMYLAKQIMKWKQTLQEDLTCSICLETICCDKCICVLMCGHHYHFNCIYQNQSGKCPMCRT
jgi:hypothetical protein